MINNSSDWVRVPRPAVRSVCLGCEARHRARALWAALVQGARPSKRSKIAAVLGEWPTRRRAFAPSIRDGAVAGAAVRAVGILNLRQRWMRLNAPRAGGALRIMQAIFADGNTSALTMDHGLMVGIGFRESVHNAATPATEFHDL